MAEPGFWDNKDAAQADVAKVSRLRSLLEPFRGLETRINDLAVLHEMAAEEAAGDVGPGRAEQVAAALAADADESHRDAFTGRHGAAATERGSGHKRGEGHGAGRGRSATQELAAGKPAG